LTAPAWVKFLADEEQRRRRQGPRDEASIEFESLEDQEPDALVVNGPDWPR